MENILCLVRRQGVILKLFWVQQIRPLSTLSLGIKKGLADYHQEAKELLNTLDIPEPTETQIYI